MTKVTIGIQARSTSTRLPNKVSEILGDKTILQHVIDACQNAAIYLNKGKSLNIVADVVVLIPFNDPLKTKIPKDVLVIEGPEDDVLTRYANLIKTQDAHYVCRVTSDCPLIPQFLIGKLITLAVTNRYDYVSNVDERCRTTADGMDCEVLSKRALIHLDETTRLKSHREHVTQAIRHNPPHWLSQGCVVNFLDLSGFKLSVDTQEDLERVRLEHEKIEIAYQRAVRLFGKRSVHRF